MVFTRAGALRGAAPEGQDPKTSPEHAGPESKEAERIGGSELVPHPAGCKVMTAMSMAHGTTGRSAPSLPVASACLPRSSLPTVRVSPSVGMGELRLWGSLEQPGDVHSSQTQSPGEGHHTALPGSRREGGHLQSSLLSFASFPFLGKLVLPSDVCNSLSSNLRERSSCPVYDFFVYLKLFPSL